MENDLVQQLISNLPDFSTWGFYLERSDKPEHPSTLVIHDNVSKSIGKWHNPSMGCVVPVTTIPMTQSVRISCYRVTLNEKLSRFGLKIVGLVSRTSGPGLVRTRTVKVLPKWDTDIMLSIVLACLYQETVSNAALNKKLFNCHIYDLRHIHQKIHKFMINNTMSIEYPPIITDCLNLIHQRVMDFEKDDIASTMTDMRSKLKFLSSKDMDEEGILTVYRESLVEDILSS